MGLKSQFMHQGEILDPLPGSPQTDQATLCGPYAQGLVISHEGRIVEFGACAAYLFSF